MKQLIVDMEDDDLERLRSLARACHIDPSNMTKEQLAARLAINRPQESVYSAELVARRSALMKMRDLWQSNVSEPIEGVEYQKTMRTEWR